MGLYFLDSSALVKRYVTEVGSGWIDQIFDPGASNQLIIARITWVEVLSALARRQREGNLAPDDTAQAIRAFRFDLDTRYRTVEMDALLVDAAGDLVMRHPLRAYDAVQLASALRVQQGLAQVQVPPLTFVCADDRLIAIAQAEGLSANNPNHHP